MSLPLIPQYVSVPEIHSGATGRFLLFLDSCQNLFLLKKEENNDIEQGSQCVLVKSKHLYIKYVFLYREKIISNYHIIVQTSENIYDKHFLLTLLFNNNILSNLTKVPTNNYFLDFFNQHVQHSLI